MTQLPDLDEAIDVTQEAGHILLEKYETGLDIGIKGADEIVTEADRASEIFLLKALPEILPGSGFYGEETGYHPGENGLTWVVDPLDGTHNYSLGIPLWACSVGLLDEERKPILGVLDFPFLESTFWAQRGGGAFVDGEPARVATAPLDGTSAIGVQSKIRLAHFPGHIQKIAQRYAARTMGSIAYSAALVAEGRMRACMDLKVKLHDIVAATVILEEAGGWVRDLDGEKIFPLTRDFEDFVHIPTPFFAGDPKTGPELLAFLFPDGTPGEIREMIADIQ